MSIPDGEIKLGLNNVIVGGRERVSNPRFSGTTNGWTSGTGVSSTVIPSGVQLSGSGNFYQTFNTGDVVNGETYLSRVLVNALTGTASLTVGLTAGGTESVEIPLEVGWNAVKFTAGATNVLSVVLTLATINIGEIHAQDSVDLFVSGSVVNG